MIWVTHGVPIEAPSWLEAKRLSELIVGPGHAVLPVNPIPPHFTVEPVKRWWDDYLHRIVSVNLVELRDVAACYGRTIAALYAAERGIADVSD